MMMMLAQMAAPEADFTSKAVMLTALVISVLANLATVIVAFRRKPSVDQDVTRLEGKINAIENRIEGLDERFQGHEEKVSERFEEGAVFHRDLASKESSTQSSVQSLIRTVSDLSSRVNDLPGQIALLIGGKRSSSH